ncbi:atlastin-1-like [Pollicipes pollicipes]|uniref:atlastin-1-like n=1 Tax=Pollicipes pollicipes TaxID=41117 RepID=UPI001884ECBB|nr:atlastin-1-like [Pollicipes pollicipes]
MECPVKLFDVDDDSGKLVLQEAALQEVLLADDVRDAPVIPVSVTGPFRKGKSSLLNVLLRFLRAGGGDGNEGGDGGDGAWLDADDATSPGFPCRGGRHPVTRGIDIWPQPLPVTLASGQPAFVLLLDSQGAFDAESTQHESVTVRALVGLLSAVQVVHVSRQLQADDLAQLRLCAEYGRLIAAAAGRPARLQRLVMLVRDWAFPDDAPYGHDGGRQVLEHWLRGDGADAADDEGDLAATVERLECFLLPRPDLAAIAGAEAGDDVGQPAVEFRTQLCRLMPWLVGPAQAEPRQLEGQSLTGADLAALCRQLAAAADAPPPPESAGDALAEEARRRAEEAALRTYRARLEETAGLSLYEAAMLRALPESGPSVSDEALLAGHDAGVRSALEHYEAGHDPREEAAAAAAAAAALQHAQAHYERQMAPAAGREEPVVLQAHAGAADAARALAGDSQDLTHCL